MHPNGSVKKRGKGGTHGTVGTTLDDLDNNITFQKLKKNLQEANQNEKDRFNDFLEDEIKKEKERKGKGKFMPKEIAGLKLYSVNEIADTLEVSPITIRGYITQGELIACKVGKSYMVEEQHLREFFLSKRYSTSEQREREGKA
jgi:excisionase family DNA binding protein